MAMIFIGQSTCSICGKILEENQSITGFPPFIEDSNHELFEYSDSGMHEACFMNWRFKTQFINAYNKHYELRYRGMRKMLDDGTIIEVD